MNYIILGFGVIYTGIIVMGTLFVHSILYECKKR